MVISGGAIAAQGSPNMTVVISVGALRYQGAKVTLPAVASLAISASDPTNPRIDTVHVPGATGAAAVVTGTPAAVPQPPSLPAGSILLGYVSVAAAAVNVGNSNITDRRLLLPVGGVLAGADLANYLSLTGAAAASHPALSALGSDTNIDVRLIPKGTGSVQLAAQKVLTQYAQTYAATTAIDWNNGDTQTVAVTGNVTFTFANPKSGRFYVIEVTQDATGSRTYTWPAAVKWSGGTAPTASGANKIDVLTFLFDGTNYIATSALNF